MTRQPRRPLRRTIASILMLAGWSMAAFVPIAEAAAERVSTGQAHVEPAGGSDACPPVHDHLACQLCRMLRLAWKPGRGAELDVFASAVLEAPSREAVAAISWAEIAGHFSRAPPTA